MIQFVEIQPDPMRELSHSAPPLRDDGANSSGVLHTLARGIQTIVTTHSPSLLRWLPDERLGQAVLLARTPEHPGTVVRRLGDLPGFFDAARTLGLEEMFGTQWLEAAL